MYEGLPDDIDVIAHQDGYATITPLHFDMTAHDYINEIKKWGI
jgi:broad specificity polyphosphatase/5'/3'-nucleotidase SurE